MPSYEFGPFLLDVESRVLLREGEPIVMTGRTLDMLTALVENRGRLISKDELLSLVWPGVVVEESNLSQSIFTLRKILGDSRKERRFIATVTGRGYQFVAPVRAVTQSPATTEIAPVMAEARLDSAGIGKLVNGNRAVPISVTAVAVAVIVVLGFLLQALRH